METAVRKPLLASALVYLAVTLLIGRDVLASLSTGILGDRFDPVLNTGILAWNAVHVPWTDAWYDFPGFYPARDALTFSEHLLGVSAIASPIYWLTQDAVITYNLTALATYVLCGLAMFALVWRLTGHGIASFLAGLAFAFAPYRASQIGHIQVLTVFWAPLSLLGLHRFLESGRRRWLALFGACWMLQGAANGYFLVFFSILVGFWVLWFVVAQRRWRELAWIAVATIVASVPLIPILLRFLEAHARYLLTRAPAEIVVHSADVSAIACGAPRLLTYRPYGGTCLSEGELFPGIVLVVLCIAGGVLAWRPLAGRSRRQWVATAMSVLLFVASLAMLRVALTAALAGPPGTTIAPLPASAPDVTGPFTQGILLLLLAGAISPAMWAVARRASVPAFYLLMAPILWALTWGPLPMLHGRQALTQGPYAWLMLLPGVDGLRVPARFWMMVLLCLCVAMGVVLAAALRRRPAAVGRAVALIAGCSLTLEGWAVLPADKLLPPPPRSDLMRGGVALTLPLGERLDLDIAAQHEAIKGGWVAVNGYSGYEAPHYGRLRDASRQVDPVVLSPFLARGDLHVVVAETSPQHIELVERQPGVAPVAAGNGYRQYRIPRQGTATVTVPAGEPLPIAMVSTSCGHDKAPLALDGDSTTRWECGPQEPGQEMTVDLGTEAMVGQVVPALGTFPNDYPRRLVIDTSRDGTTWEPAWNNDTLAEAFEALAHDPRTARMVIAFAPRPARYVRLRLASDDAVWYWSIAELEVWTGQGR